MGKKYRPPFFHRLNWRLTDASACQYISADMAMLLMYHIDKIPPICISNICS